MRAFVTRTAGGVDSLAIEELPAPGPLAAAQIRIRMRAASINYRDTAIVSGAFGPPGPHGLIPCSDGAGEIVEVAPDVSQFKVGDRIALIFNPDWIGGPFRMSSGAMGLGSSALAGTMREEIVAHYSQAVVLPTHLSFEEGAAYPCAGVTAWHALCGAAPLMPGMSVLLQGGGGVSMLALQFAKMFGARVIMTSSSPERCARLKAFGADDVIDYRSNREWSHAVRALTGGTGVDLTMDIGGAETVEHSLAATRNGGRLALVGIMTGWANTVSSLFTSGVEISPVKVGSREDYENLNRAVTFHKSRPVIAARYPFEQLPEALHYLKSGRHLGKIVIGFG
jgi:NADPH:quinone reductase-like Zn-dependent oxidoreductase